MIILKKLKITQDSNTNLTIGLTTTENELMRIKQELKSEKEKNDNLEEKHKIAHDINTTLTIKLATTEKELKRIKQELKSEKVKNDNLQSELKLTIEKLKVTQDSNTNLTVKLSTFQKELKATQVFNSDLQAKITTAKNELKEFKIKIEALEKDVKILNKQRIKGEERKIALEKLSHGYRELQETLNKINQEKFIEETKKHKDILEKAEESLNDYEEC
ncbi:6589_t:CDS:1 [Gigaspora margarita]|uniref:6589_t:CDS:1 n=1 Tax=Gigaspora margarita TaxID=4874 RepID=A0ABN7WBF4_GIGMA|nr:6589_t:CDS:1 [Gigaspora margarita]